MFVGLHALLGERLDAPDLMITEAEGKEFMQSVQNVMRHYSVETTQKTLDWVALMGTASGMYVPRIAAMSMRRKAGRRGAAPQARPSAPQAPADIVSIRPDMSGSAGFQAAE